MTTTWLCPTCHDGGEALSIAKLGSTPTACELCGAMAPAWSMRAVRVPVHFPHSLGVVKADEFDGPPTALAAKVADDFGRFADRALPAIEFEPAGFWFDCTADDCTRRLVMLYAAPVGVRIRCECGVGYERREGGPHEVVIADMGAIERVTVSGTVKV